MFWIHPFCACSKALFTWRGPIIFLFFNKRDHLEPRYTPTKRKKKKKKKKKNRHSLIVCLCAEKDYETLHTPTSHGSCRILYSQSVFNLLLPLSGLIQKMTYLWYFSYFPQKTGYDISCKLSPLKFKACFPKKGKKNIWICHRLKILLKVLNVKRKSTAIWNSRNNLSCLLCNTTIYVVVV